MPRTTGGGASSGFLFLSPFEPGHAVTNKQTLPEDVTYMLISVTVLCSTRFVLAFSLLGPLRLFVARSHPWQTLNKQYKEHEHEVKDALFAAVLVTQACPTNLCG